MTKVKYTVNAATFTCQTAEQLKHFLANGWEIDEVKVEPKKNKKDKE